jgi:hypothetical protein
VIVICWKLFTPSSLRSIKDINKYFDRLHNSDYVAFVVAKGECSLQFDTFAKSFYELGFKSDLHGKFRWAFIGVVDGGKVVYEDLQDAPLKYDYKLDKFTVHLVSEGFLLGNKCSVELLLPLTENISLNYRGFNIVVYSKSEDAIVDSVTFDSYVYPVHCIREKVNIFCQTFLVLIIIVVLHIVLHKCESVDIIKQFKFENVAFLLISFVFILYILNNIFLLMNIIHFEVFVLIIAVVVHFLWCYKCIVIDIGKKRTAILSLIICYGCIFGTALISIYFVDCSYDGRAYHQESVIAFLNGWNPFYEKASEVYPKFFEMSASIIAKVFGRIEAGKFLNLVFLVAVFFYSIKTLRRYQKNSILVLLISLMITLNPVVTIQMFTYYIDGTMGMLMILEIFALMEYDEIKRRDCLFIVLATSIFMINLKFTGFLSGVPIIVYIVKFFIEHRKKEFGLLMVTGVFALLIGVFFVGYNPYMTNFLNHGHPFWPLKGDGRIHIMLQNTPVCLLKFNVFEKFVSSIFLQGNTSFSLFANPYIVFDARISGFGKFFFLFFIIALTIGIFPFRRLKLSQNFIKVILPILSLSVCSFLIQENWWARYIPYFWYIPCLYLFSVKYNNTTKKCIMVLVFFVFCLNSFDYIKVAFLGANYQRRVYNSFFKELQNNDVSLVLPDDPFKKSLERHLEEAKINKTLFRLS